MKEKSARHPVPELVCLCIQACLSVLTASSRQAGGAEGKGEKRGIKKLK
jgi:hypothetical protein